MILRRALVITVSVVMVLGMGIGGMFVLIRLRQPPSRQVLERPTKLVRVMTVQAGEQPLIIEGFGTVRAKTTWQVVPEVSGALVQVSPYMKEGLHVKQGELLLTIDPRLYQLKLERIKTQILHDEAEIEVLKQQKRNYESTLKISQRNLKIAESDLIRDESLVSKGTISARERDRMRQSRNEMEQGVQTSYNNLQLIVPQIAKAQAAIAVAHVQLADAKLRLEKTRLLAPFDGQVVSSELDLGEFVQASQVVAELYATAAVEIPMAIALDDLRWLPALSPEALRVGAPRVQGSLPIVSSLPVATVHWRSGTREYVWKGRVSRWESGLNSRTRMLTLIVEVQEPWKSFKPGSKPPLQPGMFCRVMIVARRISNAIRIPRTALRAQNTVYVVRNSVLAVQPVEVLHVQKDSVLITSGVQSGEYVIVSPLATPVAGMKLRTREVDPRTLFTAWVPGPEEMSQVTPVPEVR